jgi:hypothetical protein
MPESGYMRATVAQENQIAASGLLLLSAAQTV